MFPCAIMELSVADWEYVGEGRLHVVVRYVGPDDAAGNFRGKVLRLRKGNDNAEPLGGGSEYEAADDAVGRIWRAFFGSPVVIEKHRIPLDEAFLRELSCRIASCRPDRRRHVGVDTRASHGHVLDDATKLLNSTIYVDVVTIELKVKCGLKSSSPFTPDSRAIKRKLGRYQIIQLDKLARYQKRVGAAPSLAMDDDACASASCPWSETDAFSRYDPCHLCSGDKMLIKNALHALMASPQNNLTISRNGRKCQDLAATCWDVDLLIDAICTVLSTNSVLQRLQVLQSFDFVDVEGAFLIFQRLECELGSRQAAEQAILESFQQFDYAAQNRLIGLLHAAATGAQTVTALPDGAKLSPMEYLFYLRISETSTGQDMDEKRQRAMLFLDGCSAQDCLVVLQFWLLALSAKDASLMVSFSQQEPAFLLVPGTRQGTIPLAGQQLFYSLGLVDMGLKDPNKCWKKGQDEEALIQSIGNWDPNKVLI